jgi:hypothetical protein
MSMAEEEGLTPNVYSMAIFAQDGCNLSGIVHDFSRVVSKVWDEAHKIGKGTDWVNTHPLCVLYADKIQSLAKTSEGSYHIAYDYCKEQSRE